MNADIGTLFDAAEVVSSWSTVNTNDDVSVECMVLD